MNSVRSWLFRVIAPLKLGETPVTREMTAAPEFPDATVIGFGKGPATPPINVALLLPVESPIVTVPVPDPPNALATVPSQVPFLIVRPVVKVFAPDKISVEVGLV